MTEIQQLLLACLRQDQTESERKQLSNLDDQRWDALVDMAKVQHVRPRVFERLSGLGGAALVPPGPWSALSTACRQIAVGNLRLHAELGRIVERLSRHAIPVIALKGAHVGPEVYGNVALRELGDLDLLVPREHLEKAVELVVADGFTPSRRFSVEVDTAVSHHVTRLLKPGPTNLELHWNITEPRQPYSIDPLGLWHRAVPFRVIGHDALALSTEDLLLHLCLHAAYLHRFEFGLRSLCDVRELLARRAHAIDWNLVRDRASAWHWMPGVRLSLELARRLLGAGVPQSEIAQFGAAPSEAICSAAAAQLLAGYDPVNTLGRGITTVGDHVGLARKVSHVISRVFLPSDLLRRDHPSVPTSWWGWWTAYLLRIDDLLRRHAKLVTNLWIKRNPELRAQAGRQKALRDYLCVP